MSLSQIKPLSKQSVEEIADALERCAESQRALEGTGAEFGATFRRLCHLHGELCSRLEAEGFDTEPENLPTIAALIALARGSRTW